MDSLTQATLGAAIGEVLLRKQIGHKGAILGAIVATIPDLDIVLSPFFSRLQNISIHRGISHSILFSIAASFLISYLLSRIKWSREVPYKQLWIFSFLALFTHIILDTFTSYGTQLFMPFSDFRAGFDSINVVDPVYTLPLLAGLVLTMFSFKKGVKNSSYNRIGILVSTAYLLATLAVKQHIIQQFDTDLEQEYIEYIDLLTVPVQFGNMNWYGVAKTRKGLHIGKYSILKPGDIQFEYFPINDHLLEDLDPWLVNRMKWFAKDFYVVAKHENSIRLYNMQCDMQGIRRFGDYMAPTAFYFEISPHPDGTYDLDVGMHKKVD